MSIFTRPGARGHSFDMFNLYDFVEVYFPAGFSQELNAEQENLQESLNELRDGLEKQPLGSFCLVAWECLGEPRRGVMWLALFEGA